MATSYPFPDKVHVISTVTLKLNDSNYLLWKTQFEFLVSSQKLIGFINGAVTAPAKTRLVVNGETTTEAPNHEYESWFCTDQLVRSWLFGTLSEEVLGHVHNLNTSREIWISLAENFNKSSVAREFSLRRSLQLLSKKDKTFSAYCRDFKAICDSLSSIGKPIDESMKFFGFLNGLGREYDPITTVIQNSLSKLPAPTFNDVISEVKGFDNKLQSYDDTVSATPHMAFKSITPVREEEEDLVRTEDVEATPPEGEASVERKAQEVDILTSRIQELETQLDSEKEECRRITSGTKKFVKEYNRFLRAQDDLKRSEARLQKLGNQLSTYLAVSEGTNRDADVDIVSDEENNGRNLRTTCDPQNELQNTSSLSRKKHYVDQYTTKEPVEDGLIGRSEEEKMEKVKKRPSRWNMDPSKSYSEEESGAWDDEDTINKSSSKEDNWKRRRLSIGTSSTDKVVSSTSMAARAFDDVAEFEEENLEAAKGSPLISLLPPPPLREAHVQEDEEDVNVVVMEQRKANDADSVF